MLNLSREFELQKMKELERIQEYANRLLGIINRVRLPGGNFSDSRVVQKILMTTLERFKTTISSLRKEGLDKGALQAKLKINEGGKEKKKKGRKNCAEQDVATNNNNNGGSNKQMYPPCQHCEKKVSSTLQMLEKT